MLLKKYLYFIDFPEIIEIDFMKSLYHTQTLDKIEIWRNGNAFSIVDVNIFISGWVWNWTEAENRGIRYSTFLKIFTLQYLVASFFNCDVFWHFFSLYRLL